MNYCVENDLTPFEFHDSTFSYVSFNGKDLVLSVDMLNIHKNTAQNPFNHDMEIASALISFKNFSSATYEAGRPWKTDEDGNSYPVGPRIVISGPEAINRILSELKNKITVYHFEKEEGERWSFGACGIEPYFIVEFAFDSCTVSWDTYKQKAWYERHRQYKFDFVLQTPRGDETAAITVHSDEEPVYYQGNIEKPCSVNVLCTLQNTEYRGRGTDYLWMDAFADLQRQLPEGILLKCCLTCRHGNLCPVGNDPNELFCFKDVPIAQKSDLFFYTEDPTERSKRSRSYCSLCEDYQPQSEDFFTYNDYPHYLKKE